MFGRLKNWINPGAVTAADDVEDVHNTNKKKRTHDALLECEKYENNDEPAAGEDTSPAVNEGDAVMAEENSSAYVNIPMH